MPPTSKQKAPWDAKYKLTSFKLPVVKAVETLVETGDFSVTTIGDNLPNENEIHEKYGSKNFLFMGSKRAIEGGDRHRQLPPSSPPTRPRSNAPRSTAPKPAISWSPCTKSSATAPASSANASAGGAQSFLKEYFSTLEEGRADLMALWNVWDPEAERTRLDLQPGRSGQGHVRQRRSRLL